MYDVSGFRPNNEKTAALILIAVIVLVAVFCAGYLFGLRNAGTDVSDNGNGIDDIREQYQHIEVKQQQITSGFESAVGRSDAAAETAGRIEERAGAAAQSVTDAGILLDECQQIIGRVRNRGKK